MSYYKLNCFMAYSRTAVLFVFSLFSYLNKDKFHLFIHSLVGVIYIDM